MLGPSHVIVGFAGAVLVASCTGLNPDSQALLAVVIGSLAPDIDGGGSISRPGRFIGGIIPRRVRSLIDGIGAALSAMIRSTVGHRGFFHWPILGVAIIAAGLPLHSASLFWFGVGYLSHILADALTIEGVPFWAPFDRSKRGLRLFTTGSFAEFLLVTLVALGSMYWGKDLLPTTLQRGVGRVETLMGLAPTP